MQFISVAMYGTAEYSPTDPFFHISTNVGLQYHIMLLLKSMAT